MMTTPQSSPRNKSVEIEKEEPNGPDYGNDYWEVEDIRGHIPKSANRNTPNLCYHVKWKLAEGQVEDWPDEDNWIYATGMNCGTLIDKYWERVKSERNLARRKTLATPTVASKRKSSLLKETGRNKTTSDRKKNDKKEMSGKRRQGMVSCDTSPITRRVKMDRELHGSPARKINKNVSKTSPPAMRTRSSLRKSRLEKISMTENLVDNSIISKLKRNLQKRVEAAEKYKVNEPSVCSGMKPSLSPTASDTSQGSLPHSTSGNGLFIRPPLPPKKTKKTNVAETFGISTSLCGFLNTCEGDSGYEQNLPLQHESEDSFAAFTTDNNMMVKQEAQHGIEVEESIIDLETLTTSDVLELLAVTSKCEQHPGRILLRRFSKEAWKRTYNALQKKMKPIYILMFFPSPSGEPQEDWSMTIFENLPGEKPSHICECVRTIDIYKIDPQLVAETEDRFESLFTTNNDDDDETPMIC